MQTPVLIALFVGVFIAVLIGLFFMFYRQHAETKSIDRRLDRLTGNASPTLESAGILRDAGMLREEASSFVSGLPGALPDLQKLFEQANFKMKPQKFWGLTLGILVAGIAIPTVLGLHWGVGLFVGPVLALMPFGYVWYLRKARLAKFGAQLCEALELVARALRAGHSLAAAMHTVAEEMPDPIASEFGRVYEEQNLGIGLETAMRSLAERVPNLDLKFFVTAVIIQRQTGGDLAEILDKIGYIIRERFKIMGMVMALTGEGRISGVILIALPFVLFGIMLKLNYEYTAMLWRTKEGQMMIAGGIVMMILGSYVIRRIVDIKV